MNEISLTIQKIFNSQFKMSKNSIISEDYLLIIGLSEEGLISVVKSSINKNFERTSISIGVFKTQTLAKELNIQQDSHNSINLIEEKLIRSLKDDVKNKFYNPFSELSKFQLEKGQEKRKIFTLETKILNDIIKHLYHLINFSDDILQFPFSIVHVEGKWEEWDKTYFPYIESIENNIIKTDVKNTKLYRNYNFALKSDTFQRVIDLLIITTKETNSEPNNQVTEELNPYDYEITFIYCNRTSKPFKYMNLLKFVNEIKSFSEKFRNDKKNKCNNIRSQLILISLFGYDLEIKDYLRNHLIRETDYIIPLLVVPPINNEVWHNFIENEDLKLQKQNDLGNIIRIGNKKLVSTSYRNNMVKSAKSEYDQIIERNKLVKFDNDFLSKWHRILDVSNSTEILKFNNDNEKLDENINIVKKMVSIY
ncbi:MAG TPA: hypothetical protein VMV43_03995 [Candidatus Nanopelagicaceae bacterium]|nr:hypothetical protein [Candidatus Nanopelagicaceae bacterium]